MGPIEIVGTPPLGSHWPHQTVVCHEYTPSRGPFEGDVHFWGPVTSPHKGTLRNHPPGVKGPRLVHRPNSLSWTWGQRIQALITANGPVIEKGWGHLPQTTLRPHRCRDRVACLGPGQVIGLVGLIARTLSAPPSFIGAGAPTACPSAYIALATPTSLSGRVALLGTGILIVLVRVIARTFSVSPPIFHPGRGSHHL